MMLNLIKNQAIQSMFAIAKESGIEQKDYYEVQKGRNMWYVFKNGKVINVFDSAIRAHEFKQEMDSKGA